MEPDTKPNRGGPLARELATKLRGHILRDCRPGERLPSEAALARKYERSCTTVRNALSILAAQGLVIRRHGSGTYVAERPGRATGTTGLLFRGAPAYLLRAPFIRDSYMGALEGVAETGRHVHLLLGYRQGFATIADDFDRRIDLSMIDSIICLEVFNHNLLAELGGQMTTVAVDFACCQHGVSSCCLDHQQNIETALEHLQSLGHRRIALVGHLSTRHSDPAIPARTDAFERALSARGMAFQPSWIVTIQDAKQAIEMVRRWAETSPTQRPTALICINCSWLVAEAAVCEGIDIPGQLSLVALGGATSWLTQMQSGGLSSERGDVQLALTGRPTDPLDPRFAPLCRMQLTEVVLPFTEMGRWAMAEVLRRIGRPGLQPRHKTFAGSIKPGNTIAPPTRP